MPFNIKVSSIGASRKGIGFGRLRSRKIKDATQKMLEQLWIDGGGVFAKRLAREVLVETGESVGSLEPLARFTNVILTFRATPKTGVKKPELNPRTGAPQGGTRSFATGVRKGKKAFDFNFAKARFSFEFTIPVFQFFLHETGRVMRPTSMVGALERARDAQEEFVLKQFRSRANDLFSKWITTGRVVTGTING